ncbi:MAG: two-component sensor histidine kinase [Ruminococcus sp.]|nr:two-component sensor histidine kinase [Ruminococcus sp.]
MAGKILKSILSVAIAVLLISFLVITGMLYQDFTYIQHNQLKDKLVLAATATENMGYTYLKQLPLDTYRLTWISPDGTVLFDSFADANTMENHSDREEIQEAFEDGNGDSLRYSDTLTEKTIYEAVMLDDGSVLRISVSRDTAAALVIEMLWPIIIIAIFAIILSACLAHRMAKQVVEPLNQLNLDEPMENETYEELTPLLHRIHSQYQEIALQMQLLKRKQQEFDKITENMKEALVLLGTDHRIISINSAAMHLFQTASPSEGKTFCAEQYEPELSRAIQSAKEHGHAEFTASVNENKFLFNVSRIEADNTVQGIVILAFDVTEQAHAEQIRRDFTSNVSHELKTPLHAIIGSAELIENGIVQTQDMPRFVGHIRKEASRLLNLIEDIIRLAQLDEGNSMPVEEVSLLAIANEVQEVLNYASEEKGVTLSVNGDNGIMCGVQSLLFELIYNLVDNAIRYNETGGSVQVSITDEPKQILLCVSDTGIGISQEHLPHIFDRFYRVDKSHSRKSGGTGLGMSIVKHAVKYHHGTINIDSKIGKGTHITVTLKKRI